MKKITADDPESQSLELTAQHLDQLRSVFPEAFTEGKVDFEVLRQLLGGSVDEEKERYGLNWYGKRQARQLALSPSRGTLRPCPEESVNWDTTQNLMIEGDNLEVLKLLQKSYAGRVKLIYIDPPYNTGKDFVYKDNFRDSLRNYQEITGQIDGNGNRLSSNNETSGRLHTDWLNMMYPRLKLARDMLRQDGVFVASIDEKEYSHLRTVCSEIFGEENFIGTIIWKNATENNPSRIATEHEYLVFFAKNSGSLEKAWKSDVSDLKDALENKAHALITQFSEEDLQKEYTKWFKDHKSELGPFDRYKYIDQDGIYTGSQSVHNPGRDGYRYDVIHPLTGKPCKQPLMGYRFPRETMDRLLSEDRILFGEDETKIIELKVYASEFKDKLSSVVDLDGRLAAYDLRADFPNEKKVFTNTKPSQLLEKVFSFITRHPGDIILDFFAGSGTTAKATVNLSGSDGVPRRYIIVQIPEEISTSSGTGDAVQFCRNRGLPQRISEITKERLRRFKGSSSDFEAAGVDFGFQVFKLDESNVKPWNLQPEDLEAELLAGVEHILPGRSELDLFYEVMLKRGLDLCAPVEARTIEGKTVYSAGAGALFGCFAESITAGEQAAIALGIIDWREEIDPVTESAIVFRDDAFHDDNNAKLNLTATLRQYGFLKVESL